MRLLTTKKTCPNLVDGDGMKLLEVQSTKEFASTFLNDIFFKMAVNRVLDAAPGFDLVYCKECKHWSDGVHGCTDHVKCCKIGFYMVGENGYCVFGERKGNGNKTEH